MKYEVSKELKDTAGNTMVERVEGEPKPITLVSVIRACLSRGLQEDGQKGVAHIMHLASLLQRVEKAEEEFELTSEEISLLKERSAKVFVDGNGCPVINVIFGFCDALEGN